MNREVDVEELQGFNFSERTHRYSSYPKVECPNCSRYELQIYARSVGGLLSIIFGNGPKTRFKERCENCNLKGEEWTYDGSVYEWLNENQKA